MTSFILHPFIEYEFSAKILVSYIMIKEIGAGFIKTLKGPCHTIDILEYFWHKIFESLYSIIH